jgi:2-deoxy-D-gluconate 3-dehydrogenase
MIRVNLSNAFRLSRAMGKHLIETARPGKSSTSRRCHRSGRDHGSWLCRPRRPRPLAELANEWAAHGINVNAIAPGYMQTDNTKALREDHSATPDHRAHSRRPMGHTGRCGGRGGVSLVETSDYVHGHVLVVDGGWMGR